MGEVGLLVAFAGGALAILSPCSALLLPAFFALAFTSRTRLLGQALLFYLGLATILVPLGLGVGVLSALALEQRDVVIAVAGALLVGIGAYTFMGGGFQVAPGLVARLQLVKGPFAAYATGLAYGFAGFCSGPILGAVLTVAATSGEAAGGALLLAVFSLGMTLPVFLLALAWDRWRIGERRPLARSVRIAGLELPLTRAVAGSLFVMLGVAFVIFRGSSALSGVYADLGLTDLSLRLETLLRCGPAAYCLR